MPTISIEVTAEQAQRISVAFGKYWTLKNPDETPRNATLAEVKGYLINCLREVVLRQEHKDAMSSIPPLDPT